MRLLAVALALAALPAAAQEREIQRSIIQRDQMTAEFAAGVRGGDVRALQNLHQQQLREVAAPLQPHPDPVIAHQLQPYERQKMADERELRLPPPRVVVKPAEAPLPLPGRAPSVVDPIPAQGLLH